MNKNEFLLQLLQEECAELIQTASKINRFGLDFQSGTKSVTNKEDFIIELNDVFTILLLLVKEGVFAKSDVEPNTEMMIKKCEKLLKYMQVSADLGHLSVFS